VLTNVEPDQTEYLTAPCHPNREALGERTLPFTRELFIDASDFSEDTTLSRKKFKRLVLGEWVRLRSAYVIRADEVIKDDEGNILQINASIVPGTLGENPPAEMKPRGVIHWVSATESVDCELRIYDRLFKVATPGAGGSDFLDDINPDSLQVIKNCKGEIGLAQASLDVHYQFEREGYFFIEAKASNSEKNGLVFNQTIGLKDSWSAKS